MELQIENGVLYGEIWNGEWRSGMEDEERFEVLVVPEGVTEIKAEAFSGHAWISRVVIPGTVKTIGKRAFYCCSNLREVEIGEGVERIEDEAFQSFRYSPHIRLPSKSLKYVGARAFDSTHILELPTGLEHIGESAFAHTSIRSVCIPGTFQRIAPEVFRDCEYLETVILQEGVEEIGEYAFSGCNNLTTVILQEGVQIIGANAFSYCNSLVELHIPDSLRIIGKDAFACAVEYTDDGRVFPDFLLPSRDIVIEDDWFKYVADTFNRYK